MGEGKILSGLLLVAMIYYILICAFKNGGNESKEKAKKVEMISYK